MIEQDNYYTQEEPETKTQGFLNNWQNTAIFYLGCAIGMFLYLVVNFTFLKQYAPPIAQFITASIVLVVSLLTILYSVIRGRE